MGFGFGSEFGGCFKELKYKPKKDIEKEFSNDQLKDIDTKNISKDQPKNNKLDKNNKEFNHIKENKKVNKEKIEKDQKGKQKEDIKNISNDLHEDLDEKIKKQNLTEMEKDLKKKIRDKLEMSIKSELKEDLQYEVKKELKLELQNEVKEELKKELQKDTKLELKDELYDDIKKELKEKINNQFSDLDKFLYEITKNLENSKFCKDAAFEILNELKENDYPFRKEKKDIAITLGYLSSVICSTDLKKEDFSKFVDLDMEVIRDNILDFRTYIRDDLFEDLFDKYNVLSENKELKIQNKELRENQKKVILELNDLINKDKIREQLDLSKNYDSNFFKKNICSPELVALFEKYQKEMNLNVNSGLKFTQRFKDYIRSDLEISKSNREIIEQKINIIEEENIIEKYILYYLSNTTYKIDKIIKKIKELKGLTTSYKTIKDLEKKYNLEGRETYRDSKIHPNLNREYFNVINTKEKAYLLGFLYADGWVVQRKDSSKIMGINVNPKDENIIDYFINCVNANISKKSYYTDNRGKDIVHLDICDQRFCNSLIIQGIIPKKSNIIEYPKFIDREKSLSFLLGFFDGDGTQGTTRITCGSKKFLEMIKKTFNISYKIDKDKRKKHSYFLHLGAELFNEMLDNFKNSLPRKRIRLRSIEERLEHSKEGSSKKRLSGILSDVKRDELKNLVWKMPLKDIGKKYGCSGRAISKKCDRLNIKKPPLGYWKKFKK